MGKAVFALVGTTKCGAVGGVVGFKPTTGVPSDLLFGTSGDTSSGIPVAVAGKWAVGRGGFVTTTDGRTRTVGLGKRVSTVSSIVGVGKTVGITVGTTGGSVGGIAVGSIGVGETTATVGTIGVTGVALGSSGVTNVGGGGFVGSSVGGAGVVATIGVNVSCGTGVAVESGGLVGATSVEVSIGFFVAEGGGGSVSVGTGSGVGSGSFVAITGTVPTALPSGVEAGVRSGAEVGATFCVISEGVVGFSPIAVGSAAAGVMAMGVASSLAKTKTGNPDGSCCGERGGCPKFPDFAKLNMPVRPVSDEPSTKDTHTIKPSQAPRALGISCVLEKSEIKLGSKELLRRLNITPPAYAGLTMYQIVLRISAVLFKFKALKRA